MFFLSRLMYACAAVAVGIGFAAIVHAQSSQDDLCTIRLEQEGFPVGGCVESSACNNINGGDFAAFIPPNESPLCAPSEVCCYSESGGGLGEFTPAPAEPAQATSTSPAAPGRGSLKDGRSYLMNPLGGRTVPQIVGQVVAWFGTAAGALFFLYLLWGGAEWMTARGDEAQAQRARQRIVAAVAGIGVVLLAYMLVSSLIRIVPQ